MAGDGVEIALLPQGSALVGTERLPGDDGSKNCYWTPEQIKDYVASAIAALAQANNLSDVLDKNAARNNLAVPGLTSANAFTDATDSTSSTTGAIKTAGGLGVAKSLNVGGDAKWAGAAATAYTPTQSGTATGTATGAYKLFGKLMWIDVEFAATSTGTVILSMPSGITGQTSISTQFVLGINSGNGNLVFGTTTTNNGKISVKTPTFTDPATSGSTLRLTGVIYIN